MFFVWGNDLTNNREIKKKKKQKKHSDRVSGQLSHECQPVLPHYMEPWRPGRGASVHALEKSLISSCTIKIIIIHEMYFTCEMVGYDRCMEAVDEIQRIINILQLNMPGTWVCTPSFIHQQNENAGEKSIFRTSTEWYQVISLKTPLFPILPLSRS